jgi:hypothetical protein
VRRSLVIAVAWIAACSRPVATGQPPEAETLLARENGTPAVTIVRAEIDGHSAWMFLDSGAEMSVLDQRVADRWGLRSRWRATAGECNIPVGIVRGKRLEVGAVALEGPWFATLDIGGTGLLDDLELPHEIEVAGILGAPLFQNAIVAIEYGDLVDQVSVWPKGEASVTAATWIPLHVAESRAFVDASLDRAGAARFLVDTGKNGSLSLLSGFVREHAIDRGRKLRPAPNRRLCGVTEELVTELDWFELGGFRLERPTAALKVRGSPGDDAIAGESGMVGQGFLRDFDVVFDYARGRLGLTLRP